MDWQVLLLLAFVVARWQRRSRHCGAQATRWAARACLTVVVLAVVLIGALWWGAASREPPEHLADEWVQYGDDSGVIIAMLAVGIAVGLVVLVGWAVASAHPTMRGDQLPPPPTSATGSGP